MLCLRVAFAAPGRERERALHLDAHRAFLRGGALAILHSGPFLGPDGAPIGALVVAEAASIAAMEQACAADPYAVHGVYARCTFAEWRPTIGPHAAAA
jgi:uncharacterized protein